MGATNHSGRAHAILSASGAQRWLNCTPSARLETKFKESKTSVFAQEGTLAHEFGDLALRLMNLEITKKQYAKEVRRLKKHELYSEEMDKYVQMYVDYVQEALTVARQSDPTAVLLIEQRLDFSHIVPKGFGTGDATIIADGTMEVIDLKYGKGIEVEAQGNPQLKLYGLGALNEFELSYDITRVKLTVVQPRLSNFSTHEMPVSQLEEWGESYVKPQAEKAYAGEGEQVAGDWCRFCKVKAMCRTFAQKNLELAKHDFKDPQLLEEDELLEIYKQQPMLQDWVSSVADYITKSALDGKQWPGYKLVEGRSVRKITNPDKVAEILQEQEYDIDQFMPRKLEGIGKIEKIVGKENVQPLLGEYIVKPEGKPTLVPDTDKRPAIGIESVKADFAKDL